VKSNAVRFVIAASINVTENVAMASVVHHVNKFATNNSLVKTTSA